MKIKSGEVLEDQEAIHRFQSQMLKLPASKSIIRSLWKKISEENTSKTNL